MHACAYAAWTPHRSLAFVVWAPGSCALVIFNCKATLLQDALHQPGGGVVQRAVAAVQGALPRVLHNGEIGADIGLDLCM